MWGVPEVVLRLCTKCDVHCQLINSCLTKGVIVFQFLTSYFTCGF